MAASPEFPLFREALGRHLASLQGLTGVQAFLREGAGLWQEAARFGNVDETRMMPALDAYDPEGGGAVEAVAGAKNGWNAHYMLGGAGLDLVLMLRFDGVAPSDLQVQLSAVEARVGWLMVAALSDRSAEMGAVAIGTEVGAQILLDAARARTRRLLADQWVARLEKALTPDLIAVTWLKGDTPKLVALSGGGVVERNSEARSQIEALADHAVRARAPQIIEVSGADRDSDLPDLTEDQLPDPKTQNLLEDMMARIRTLGGQRGLSLPVYRGDDPKAVVVCIWSEGSFAGEVHPESADLLAQVLSESLTIQTRAFPSIWRRLGNWAWAIIRGIFGPTAWRLKLFVVVLVAVIIGLAMWPSQFQPSFSARIEAQDRRVVSAPYDGFLAQAPFQLGDSIAPGEIIVALEDTDLVLQIAEVQSELAGIETEVQAARAQRDSARVQSLEAQGRQIEVRLSLFERQLDLARFEAETAAVVVGGDAWRRVGGRVRLGEPLLELAAPDAFRVLVFIDEDWVADLAPQASGALLLTAHPGSPIEVTLTNITSDPQVRDGVNTFTAWMDIEATPEVVLLDGMRGVVRIDGEATSMLGAYTRGALRWVRRTIWRWS
ncbi:MAG: HlyD family efflux transporter periplasmic adaptor subunit [Roseicyclus sp.]|nr:HlyD family efflux transporter periplasmic adaptor subunit [Roseicyclus sp.]